MLYSYRHGDQKPTGRSRDRFARDPNDLRNNLLRRRSRSDGKDEPESRSVFLLSYKNQIVKVEINYIFEIKMGMLQDLKFKSLTRV